jgi:hypothetical protein
LVVLIIHPISGAASKSFVEARHQGLALLAEFIHHLGEARQIVAAWEAPLVFLQLGLRPVEIIDRDGDHSIANLVAQPAFAATWWGAEPQQALTMGCPLLTPLLQQRQR